MALIGDGTNAALGISDYSGAAQGAWNLANSDSKAFQGLGNSLADAADLYKKRQDQQRDLKDSSKIGADKIDAAIKLFGDKTGALAGLKNQLLDEETPLSQRGGLGKQVDGVLNLFTDKIKSDATQGNFDKTFGLEQQRQENANVSANQSQQANQISLDQAQKGVADQAGFEKVAGPAMLNQLLSRTQEYEKTGGKPIVPSSQIQDALNLGPTQQMKVAELAASGLPQAMQDQILKAPVTINGQPGEKYMKFNGKTGRFDDIPTSSSDSTGATDTSWTSKLPAALQPHAQDFIDAGKQYGIDPRFLASVSEFETGGGTSSAFRNKNNAMGISDSKGPIALDSAKESIFRQAHALADPNGPYAGRNTVGGIGSVYSPPGAGNDPNGTNGQWPAAVAANLQKYGGNPQGSVRVQMGASTAKAQTPLEIQLQQAQLAKANQDLAGTDVKQTQAAKELNDTKWSKIDNANRSIMTVDELLKHPGFSAAIGSPLAFGESPIALPGTDKAGAQALLHQVKSRNFLEGIQAMKGIGRVTQNEVSRLEGAVGRMDANQSEKDFQQSALELKAALRDTIEKAGGKVWGDIPPVAPVPVSTADKLRNLLNQYPR